MTDETSNRMPSNANHINVAETWEVDYWCQVLKCNETELRTAVRAVGTSAVDVKRYLGPRPA